MANFSCLLVKMAMQLRVYDTFRLKVEQRSDGPESDNIAQTRDAQFLTGIYEAFSDVHVLLVLRLTIKSYFLA